MNRWRVLGGMILTGLVLGAGSPAGAQSLEPSGAAEELEVGSAADQLVLDLSVLPAGHGAVFVPSLSRPELEPLVRVLNGDAIAGRGSTGQRIAVPPGTYRVVVGQGPATWRASRSVTVTAGQTTIADGFVGAVRVTAAGLVDEAAVATGYSLVSDDGQRIYGPEVTAERDVYQATRTWLLPPGAYRIVPGDDRDERRGAVALTVGADTRSRVRLWVTDDGEIVGSSPADRPLRTTQRDWRISWTVGGSVSLGQAQGQLSGFSGESIRLEAFTDAEIAYDRGPHLAVFGVGLEQGWVGLQHQVGQGLPLQKLNDSFRLELTYNFRLGRVVGPYVRATARGSLFPTVLHPDRELSMVTIDAAGAATESEASAGGRVRLMTYLSPIVLQEGAGLAITALDTRAFGLGLRVGVAARQAFYGEGARYVRAVAGDRVELRTLTDTSDVGPEVGAWLRLKIARWLHVRSGVDAFVPLASALEGQTLRPVFALDTTVSLRLASWATLVYRAVLHRDDESIDRLQYRQSLNLRFQYSIF